MERLIEFTPAYDNRSHDVHGVELRFVLKGDRGAVQFVLYTNWQWDAMRHPLHHPMPVDLGYHSPTPQYEGQIGMKEPCPYVDGVCYYDGSTLNAGPVYEALLHDGSDGVWRCLEKYYASVFGAEVAAVDASTQTNARKDRHGC